VMITVFPSRLSLSSMAFLFSGCGPDESVLAVPYHHPFG
jgi:hypothetical protein